MNEINREDIQGDPLSEMSELTKLELLEERIRSEICASMGLPPHLLNAQESRLGVYFQHPSSSQINDGVSGYEITRAALEVAHVLQISLETVRVRCQEFCLRLPISYAQAVFQINRYVKQFGEFPRSYEDLRMREHAEMFNRQINFQNGMLREGMFGGRMPHPPDTVKMDCKYYFDSSKLPAAENKYPICSVNPEAKSCKDCSDYE